MPTSKKSCETKYKLPLESRGLPLKLHDRLINNVNTWGNVEYNIPLRSSRFETRTSTNVAHRLIPQIPHAFDTACKKPLPERLQGRDKIIGEETYKTTSGAYEVKPNPNSAMERADCAMNCKKTIFMTGVEKRLQKRTIIQPLIISEMKDKFRGAEKPALAPPEIIVKAPDPEFIFDVVASGRNEAPVIPEDTPGGFRKLLDPYLTTYRANHRIFSAEDQYGIGAKDQITFYSEFNTPRVKGFGPRHKEIWMPLQSKPHVAVFDRIHLKKEYKEVAAAHNLIPNIKGRFQSEMKLKYKIPFAESELATFDHGEVFDFAPIPPNPYQTNIAPFMYCSDYCHIAQGTPPYSVIDQFEKKLSPHRRCQQNYLVSRDFTV